MNKSNKAITSFWNDFLARHPQNSGQSLPESFYFCDNEKDANDCAELVVKGIKQATATSLWWFEKHQEPLPQVGNQYIVTNWQGKPKAVIETTQVIPTPYHEVSAEFAEAEGEGDKSLVYWKQVHEAYYKREMAPHGDAFDEGMVIICEHFKTLFTGD